MKKFLPGIKKIWFLNSNDLPEDVLAKSMSGMPVVVKKNLNGVLFCGQPTCEYETKYEEAAFREEVTLEFNSTANLPLSGVAFVVEDVNDERFLIGTKERPWPVVERTRNFGQPTSNTNSFRYVVKTKSLKALIPVFI